MHLITQGRHVKKNVEKAEEYFQKFSTFEKQNNRKLASSSSDLIQSSYYRRRWLISIRSFI